ncbi:hypothetical protein [Flavobacterium sp. ov086]|uniref:hypothetical protein n=1 Tax=Flavobacterium sp. ov086 TaxID=1761785 RepID=UPI000B669562|nr:hypothetical protein [Flavobacterium sp. ov086]SNR33478.1 hypothetical protein SAMN04487979_103128 [Flavobacterium sp. ov086]
MKKLILFVAFASLFTIFSCTPEEYETQPKKETEKVINPSKPTYADGPGDDGTIRPKPPIKTPGGDE